MTRAAVVVKESCHKARQAADTLLEIFDRIAAGQLDTVPVTIQGALDGNVAPGVILKESTIGAMNRVAQLFEGSEYNLPEIGLALIMRA